MPTIFLSYRRDDSKAITWEISKQLKRRYGDKRVIMDVDAIPIGHNYRDYIKAQLAECDALVVVIGKHWASRNDKGELRINEESDWVRLEIEAALGRDIPVIPLQVDGGELPDASDLPESMRAFIERQAIDVESGPRFDAHMANFAKLLDEQVASRPKLALIQVLLSLDGRIDRAWFWAGILLWLAATDFILELIAVSLSFFRLDFWIPHVTAPLGILGIYPDYAVISKRLHDLDKSGWMAFTIILPLYIATYYESQLREGEIKSDLDLVFSLALVVLYLIVFVGIISLGLIKGTDGPNRYGPDPLARGDQRPSYAIGLGIVGCLAMGAYAYLYDSRELADYFRSWLFQSPRSL
jgi:uncharacterized membrane protein YhaH (DUF805 family)